MSADRISHSDWRAWLHHIATNVIRGTALAVKSTLAVFTAGQVTSIQLEWHVLGVTALVGFIWALVESLSEKPFPTGDEVPDDDPPPAPPSAVSPPSS